MKEKNYCPLKIKMKSEVSKEFFLSFFKSKQKAVSEFTDKTCTNSLIFLMLKLKKHFFARIKSYVI